MNETLQLIDQLIAEHKVIKEKTESLEKTANDASLLTDLAKARDTFVPGQPNQSPSLQKLNEMLESIDAWLKKHFEREETALLPALRKLDNQELLMSLEALLFEHTDLRDRMFHSRNRVTELLSGQLAANIWEATAKDIRVHLSHTWKLLVTHAGNENRYFNDLRKKLKKTDN
jgi:iron-sulfur cluster repair protein YtfE (RIC family)